MANSVDPDEMVRYELMTNEPVHSISYKITCAPREDSDQPAHPHIGVVAGHYMRSQ